ncbi:MAG: hypothetical protein JSV89_20545 [Spirochaetaceae bacterium]|nr:MAG: hypothetical protein JSV89_20545 [Spirochaetaceae bacterium]
MLEHGEDHHLRSGGGHHRRWGDGGQRRLWYKSFPVQVGLLRGTFSDSFGNISFENEVMTAEALSIAQAVKNSGGTVIVQVEDLAEDFSRDPKLVCIPGIIVDAVVIAEMKNHMQTFSEQFNPDYLRQGNIHDIELPPLEAGPRRYVSCRAFQEIRQGNVNVSKFSGRLAGIGGFMNITQTAKRIVFMGTFTAGGLETAFWKEELRVLAEGRVPKFIAEVEQVTFSGPYALKKGQEVLYITERAVFRLTPEGPELVEVAPGIDVERDIRKQMRFPLRVAKKLVVMDAGVFLCAREELFHFGHNRLCQREHSERQNPGSCGFRQTTWKAIVDFLFWTSILPPYRIIADNLPRRTSYNQGNDQTKTLTYGIGCV